MSRFQRVWEGKAQSGVSKADPPLRKGEGSREVDTAIPEESVEHAVMRREMGKWCPRAEEPGGTSV